MKLKVRTLSGSLSEYEVKEDDTIFHLKEDVAARNNVDVSSVRLAFSARVLKDDDTIAASRLKEGCTIIAVFSKPKPAAKAPEPAAPAPKVEEPKTAEEPKAPAVEAPKTEEPKAPEEPKATEEPKAPAVEAPKVEEPRAPEPRPAAPVHQELQVDEEKVAGLMAMGFGRDECVKALRLAYNNSERAVQFLVDGMPAEGEEEDEPEPAGGLPPQMDSHAIFQRLIQEPQFIQLRSVIQSNPALLESLMSQFQQTNPAIYQILVDNREEFSQWLSEGATGSSPVPPTQPTGPIPTAQPAPRPGAIQLDLSAEDRAAVQTLVDMGFDQGEAIQAYIACDKNLELAANLLMSGGF